MSISKKQYIKFVLDKFQNDIKLNNKIDKIWLYTNVPKNHKIYLYPGDDKIDIVAIINGNDYLVQCIYKRNPNDKIMINEISTTFGISYGIIVTNSNRLSKKIMKINYLKVIYSDFFDKIPQQLKLHNYQKKCVDKISKYIVDNSKCYIEMTPTCNNILITCNVVKKIKSLKTIIFVSSSYLLSQYYLEWIHHSKKILLIDSTKLNGIISTTSSYEIQNFLNNNKFVIICTYQYSHNLFCSKNINYDLAIFDSAENIICGNTYLPKLDITKCIYITSTSNIYHNNYKLQKYSVDRKIFGKCVYQYGLDNAIMDKNANDYKIVMIHSRKKYIQKQIKKYNLKKIQKKFDNENYLGYLLIILHKINIGDVHHLIIYHNSDNEIELVVKYLIILNDLIYDTNIYIGNNLESNEFVNSEFGILCTNTLSNVSISIIDSIYFIDDYYKTYNILNCINCCLHLSCRKKKSKIIIPFICDRLTYDYHFVIQILKSLMDIDNRIEKFLKSSISYENLSMSLIKAEIYEKNNMDRQLFHDNVVNKLLECVNNIK